MKFRPKGWDTTTLASKAAEIRTKRPAFKEFTEYIFEAGADAMLEALRKIGSRYEPPGTVVYIPDDTVER